jgi:hypothetical protein
MKFSQQKDLALLVKSLNIVPKDEPLKMHWRKSDNNHPNLRVTGITQGNKWTVDIYSSSYFCARLETLPTSEIFTNVRSLVYYLCRYLKVKLNKN